MKHQPALDGVRGVSVALVLLFHGGWAWASGGYVGVSVFFTLSGFLITSLLLREHTESGSIAVSRFWGRRMRRLMPASMVCLIGVVVLAAVGAFGNVPSLSQDLLGCLLQLANWFELAGQTTYAEQVMGLQSPVDHYWSLAIEEQFYWIWPLAMLAIMRARRPQRVIVALTVAAGVAAPAVASVWGGDAAYWSTPARVGEILVGATLASALHYRNHPVPRWVAGIGWPSLAVVIWATLTWPVDRGPAYNGWLPIFALASAGLILALQVPSPLQRMLAVSPLVALGAISYGVYLFHWPIFLLVDRHGPSNHLIEFVIAVAITLLVSVASYRFIEQPIRHGAGTKIRLATAGAVSVAAVVGLAAIAAPTSADDRFAHPEQAAGQLAPVTSLEQLVALDSTSTTTTTTTIAAAPETTVPTVTVPAPSVPVPTTEPPIDDIALAVTPSRPVRILVVGDSTAWALGDGLTQWADANPALADVSFAVSPGCGLIRTGFVTSDADTPFADDCRKLLDERLPLALEQLQPDVVVLMTARTDVLDRIWSTEEGELTNADPRFQDHQRADYEGFVDWLLGVSPARLLWVQPLGASRVKYPDDEMSDPERLAVLASIIDEVVTASDPVRVEQLDLPRWYATSGLADADARPDGLHFDLSHATQVAMRLVGPAAVNFALMQ